jgi:transcriptional regulator with XRE-family HTH domain
MTNIEYKALRETVGSQKKVAEALGIDHSTLQRREYGKRRISREAEVALLALAARLPLSGRLVGKMGRPFTSMAER